MTTTTIPGDEVSERDYGDEAYPAAVQSSNGRVMPKPGEMRPATDYQVPLDIQFQRPKGGEAAPQRSGRGRRAESVPMVETKYLEAPGLENIANALISIDPNLAHLEKRSVMYYWRRNGGKKSGALKFGECKKPTDLLEERMPGVDYVIWLAADHCREFGLTRDAIEEALYHELLHTGDDDSDEPLAITLPHDYEGFAASIRRYGVMSNGGVQVARAIHQVVQPGLFDTPEKHDSPERAPVLRFPEVG